MMVDIERFLYLINQCLRFLWTRDQQEEIQRLGNALVEENERLRAENERLETENDRLETALHQIEQWSRAYPLKVFPEPDFERVHELLKAGGISIDSVSASNMRHVVEGVGKIAREALKEGEK
jgi:regulator of replication initiation timing